MRRVMVCLFVCFFAAPSSALAGRVRLQWDAPEPNVSYFIRYGTQSGNLPSRFEAGTETTATIPDLTDGRRYFFVVYAYDTTRTSPASNEVSVVVQADPAPAPAPAPAPGPAPAPAPEPAPAPTPAPAPPTSTGTRVPPASQVVDDSLAVWTIGSGGIILRNGTWANGGMGSQILWYQGAIYVFGTNSIWYQWNNGWWEGTGPYDPTEVAAPSSGSLRVPPATTIVDNMLAVWSIGPDGMILRDGVWISGGLGSQILWVRNTIYVLGTDSNWWQWTGDYWTFFGSSEPR